MTYTIALPRSVVEQALDLVHYLEALNSSTQQQKTDLIYALRAALDQPQVEQEPVAWIENIGGGVSYNPYHEAARKLPDGVRFDLYTHPQPKRQPLAEDEIAELMMRIWGCASIAPRHAPSFARAIERAHGIGGEK